MKDGDEDFSCFVLGWWDMLLILDVNHVFLASSLGKNKLFSWILYATSWVPLFWCNYCPKKFFQSVCKLHFRFWLRVCLKWSFELPFQSKFVWNLSYVWFQLGILHICSKSKLKKPVVWYWVQCYCKLSSSLKLNLKWK